MPAKWVYFYSVPKGYVVIHAVKMDLRHNPSSQMVRSASAEASFCKNAGLESGLLLAAESVPAAGLNLHYSLR